MKGNRTKLRRLLVSSLLVFAAAGLKSNETPRIVTADDITSVVSQHRGKVVLLNFWATWCPPCLLEFPEIVAVEREYRKRGLVVVSVSADSLERVETELLPFLDEHQPGFEIYIRGDEAPDIFIKAVDPGWKGELPATFFYDRQGRPSVKRYSEMPRDEIERIVEYLLNHSD
jgi:thiol-disulfide isomerase/thioredoxin